MQLTSSDSPPQKTRLTVLTVCLLELAGEWRLWVISFLTFCTGLSMYHSQDTCVGVGTRVPPSRLALHGCLASSECSVGLMAAEIFARDA